MKTVLRNTCLITMAFFAATGFTRCAKTPQPGEPVPPPPAAAERQGESGRDEARKVIVAKVNGAALTMDALVKMMNRLPARGSGPEALEEHKKRSLDKLVLQELAYQQAKAQGLEIGGDKIDMAINNLKSNVGGGEREYNEYLKRHDLTEAQLRSQVERSLLIELVYAKEVLAKVNIPEEDLRREYEQVKHRYIMPEKASVIDVFILKHEGVSSRKKALNLLAKIKADPDKNPWSLVLDGTFIVRSLNIKKDRDKELMDAAVKLKPQELSGVISAADGLHIIKLKNYSPERQLTFEEAKSGLEGRFKVPAQEKRTQEWERELKKDARIEIMNGS